MSLFRRLPTLGVSALLLVAGGSGLLAAAFSDGPAGADSTLGGFTVSGLAEAVTAQYEQPNFPLPATPSLEFDEGYAATTDNFGPSGTATASSLYPGQVVANAGPELALLVPGAPLPPAPIWPVQATSEYPQAPNSGSTDQPGVNMDASSTTNGNTASATLGDDAATAGSNGADPTLQAPSGSGNPLAGSSAIIGVGNMSATSSSLAPSTSANAQASATDTGISILGGFITIGSVTSTATAISDGTTGKLTGSTAVQNMDIAGQPVTVDASGIQAEGQSAPLALPISSINTLLGELGISMSVTNPTDAVNGASASRTLDGLKISIDLKTLDAAANMFASLLPASLTSQLPVALPNDQQLTLDLATVQVSSTASPAFAAGNSGNSGAASSSAAAPVDAVGGLERRGQRQLGHAELHRRLGHGQHVLGRHVGVHVPDERGLRFGQPDIDRLGAGVGHLTGLQGDRGGAGPPRPPRRLRSRLRLQAGRRRHRAARHLVRRRRPADGALYHKRRRPR